MISVSGRGLRLVPSSFFTVTFAVSPGSVGTLGTLEMFEDTPGVLLIGVTLVVTLFCGWDVMQPLHTSASGIVRNQPEMRHSIVVLVSVRDWCVAIARRTDIPVHPRVQRRTFLSVRVCRDGQECPSYRQFPPPGFVKIRK